MVDLDSLAGLGIRTERDRGPEKPRNELGQDDFLKLMIAQMQNQDPFSPMENGEFLTQIAQFTTANGMSELQNSFSRFQQDMAGDQALRAAGLVGRNVLVESREAHLAEGGTLDGIIKVPQSVSNLKLRIYSGAGELVREVELGGQTQGDLPFQWDGVAGDGRALPPGNYRISAETIVEGQPVSLQTLTSANVISVALKNGQSPMLNLQGIGEQSLAAVRQIQ